MEAQIDHLSALLPICEEQENKIKALIVENSM